MRGRSALVAFLLSGLLVSGCFGGQEGAPASADGSTSGTPGTDSTAPSPGPALSPRVNITNHTSKFSASSPKVSVDWSVGLGAPNAGLAARMTVLAWADRSVAHPIGPSSYGNQSGRRENATVPGEFNASFTPSKINGTTVYFRAFAEINGTVYWSEERSAALDVKPPGPPAPGVNRTHEVSIGKNVPGSAADYDPPVLQIKTGDSVRFLNKDSASHTATDRLGTWGTGSIAGGGNSTLQFTAVARYAYHCTIHAGMAGAVLDVGAR